MILDVARLPVNVSALEPFVAAGIFGATEVRVASFVLEQTGVDDDFVALAIAAATWAMSHGHDCADLLRIARVVEHTRRRLHADDGDDLVVVEWPDPSDWRRHLESVPSVVRVASAPDQELDDRPVVLCGDSVYLQRLWIDECLIARAVVDRAVDVPVDPAIGTLLDLLLPTSSTDPRSTNHQRDAADAVLRSRVAVIAGGPGTGKTYSVARVLAALIEASARDEGTMPSIALVAPTGKAATRLGDTIADAADSMTAHVSSATIDHLRSITPTTIHRLLGAMGTTGRFRRNANDPLVHDIVIVDETSMVSLSLMARLVDAIRPDTRLVLVGDPGQLESVQEGAVLADLVLASTDASEQHPLRGRVVELTENHRFGGNSPIHTLAMLVRTDAPYTPSNRPSEPVTLGEFVASAHDHDSTHEGQTSTVRFVDVDDVADAAAIAEVRAMVEPSLHVMRDAAERGDTDTALAALGEVRILCAHRRGPAGVTTWNRLAEQWLRGPQRGRSEWYAGRPVLITRNDDRLGLSNGDTGVVVHDGERLLVAFPGTKAAPRLFSTFALSDIDTCFAMTVHKSQGSEYPSVALVLPPARSPLIGRELAYTGITRARNRLLVVGSSAVLAECAASPAERMTGLVRSLGVR